MVRLRIHRANLWIADKMASLIQAMMCFWLLNFLILSVLYFQLPKTPLDWLTYVVQTWFQGVALPLLGFAGAQETKKIIRLLLQIHEDRKQEHKETQEILLLMQKHLTGGE